MKDIEVRNAEQIGRAIRLKRLEKGFSQNAFAARLGVERKWVIHLEAGNRKAELGLVLKALDALNLRPCFRDEDRTVPGKVHRPMPSRLDEVFRHLQRPQRR